MLNTKGGRNASQSADRKRVPIEHASQLCARAKLADKICNVRDGIGPTGTLAAQSAPGVFRVELTSEA